MAPEQTQTSPFLALVIRLQPSTGTREARRRIHDLDGGSVFSEAFRFGRPFLLVQPPPGQSPCAEHLRHGLAHFVPSHLAHHLHKPPLPTVSDAIHPLQAIDPDPGWRAQIEANTEPRSRLWGPLAEATLRRPFALHPSPPRLAHPERSLDSLILCTFLTLPIPLPPRPFAPASSFLSIALHGVLYIISAILSREHKPKDVHLLVRHPSTLLVR